MKRRMGWVGMGWERLGELLLGDGASSCASRSGSATQARTIRPSSAIPGSLSPSRDACCCGAALKLPNGMGYEEYYEKDAQMPW